MIHDTSVIDPSAVIAGGVRIGPFCVIGGGVEIGEGTEIKSHVVVQGKTKIGKNNIIYPFASIGQPPQDLKYGGEDSSVIIGDGNVIREYVTVQKGTKGGGMVTEIGNSCLLMVGVHIAHDCRLGDGAILANYVSLAGHVRVGDGVVMGGLSAARQFVRIGEGAILGGLSGLAKDLPPFCLASSDRAYLEGLNLVGLKRSGADKATVLEASAAIKEIFLEDGSLFEKRIAEASKKYAENAVVSKIISFLEGDSRTSICSFRKKGD